MIPTKQTVFKKIICIGISNDVVKSNFFKSETVYFQVTTQLHKTNGFNVEP